MLKKLLFAAAIVAGAAGSGPAFSADLALPPEPGMRYVPPITNPTFNETPFITTELRPIYIYHDIPSGFLTNGGDVNVVAAQIRYALTDRLALIATKDGYSDLDFNAGLPDTDGFLNIAAGLKYAFIVDPVNQFMLSGGVRYEIPAGNIESGGVQIQEGGDGFINLFVTAAKEVGALQVQGSANVNLAIDSDHDSSIFVLSLHANYELTENFFPLVEFNMFSVIDHGNRTVGDFEGYDVFNFGSTDAGTVASVAGGFRYRLLDNMMLGAAAEVPITDRQDLTEWRVTADAVLTF